MEKTRADHYKEQTARIAAALRAAGIDKFEETDEVVHIPTVRDAHVRIRVEFKVAGEIWRRVELFDKPNFQVNPIGVPNGRRTNHNDPAKAAAKAAEQLRAATASKNDETFWIAQNERVAALIAPAVAKFDERASKFGWRVRHIHVAGFKGYGKLEIFRPDPERPQLTFLERRVGVRFPLVDDEGKRLNAYEGPVVSCKVGNGTDADITLSELAAATSVLFDAARECDLLVKEA